MFLVVPIITVLLQLIAVIIHPKMDSGYEFMPWCYTYTALQVAIFASYFLEYRSMITE